MRVIRKTADAETREQVVARLPETDSDLVVLVFVPETGWDAGLAPPLKEFELWVKSIYANTFCDDKSHPRRYVVPGAIAGEIIGRLKEVCAEPCTVE